jgi:hypothetical protein
MRNVSGHFWSGAHQAHRSTNHIDELGQLVDLPTAQPSSCSGDPDISGHRHLRSTNLPLYAHRPKLKDAEGSSVSPDTPLPKENWPRGIKFDQQCNDDEQRREHQKPSTGNEQVKTTFDHGKSRTPHCHAKLQGQADHPQQTGKEITEM